MTNQRYLPAPGTRLPVNHGGQVVGATVRPYMRDLDTPMNMLGIFPVELDNHIWRWCDANDVSRSSRCHPAAQLPERPVLALEA
jgi:hypothetical protein